MANCSRPLEICEQRISYHEGLFGKAGIVTWQKNQGVEYKVSRLFPEKGTSCNEVCQMKRGTLAKQATGRKEIENTKGQSQRKIGV